MRMPETVRDVRTGGIVARASGGAVGCQDSSTGPSTADFTEREALKARVQKPQSKSKPGGAGTGAGTGTDSSGGSGGSRRIPCSRS